MKNTRSYKIKRILKENYPNTNFSVKIDKFSMGESINIKTDLIKEYPCNMWEYLHIADEETRVNFVGVKKNNDKIKTEIQKLLKDYYHIERDRQGSILSGGNTYLHIDNI